MGHSFISLLKRSSLDPSPPGVNEYVAAGAEVTIGSGILDVETLRQ
jgi:hypothetical protein